MPYVCPNCGERDRFVADASCRRTYMAYGTVIVHGDGDWEDFEESDSDGTDTEDLEFENVRCEHCNEQAQYCQTAEEADRIAAGNGTIVASSRIVAHVYEAGEETRLRY